MDPYAASAFRIPVCLGADVSTYLMSAPNEVTTPKLARDFVRALVRAVGLGTGLQETVALLTSETVTNAHLHGASSHEVLVRVLVAGHGVRVSVHDDHPGLLTVGPGVGVSFPTDEAECGRGLLLLESLADRWGITPRERAPLTKCVWFELYEKEGGER